MSVDSKVNYKDTIFLPQTSFPLRGNLSEKEVHFIEYWDEINLYQRIREKSKNKEKFILHDGPPYANGAPHMGHFLNRVLKDIVIRMNQMSGKDAPFVPGWDCHGLPIEWKVEENYRKQGTNKDQVPREEFRSACHEFASYWVNVHRNAFKRFGTMADWENPYLTFDPKAEACMVREIGKFLLNGSLYRGERPVLWSVVENTALAEAEVEYHDKTSTYMYIAFPIIKSSLDVLADASCPIWTTTPWTIPANRAISYSEDSDYVVATYSTKRGEIDLLVAVDLIDQVAKGIKASVVKSSSVFKGSELKGTICQHPLSGRGYDFDVPLLPGDHVTVDSGTGLVHTAPTHGVEDFAVGKQFGLEIPKTVKEDGTYYDSVPLFGGQHIFKVDPMMIELLRESECLLSHGTLIHSYPHSWRSKAPLIYRTTPQWFISLDKTGIREKALEEIKSVNWYPKQGYNRIKSFIENRGDWCISRQRVWGVPIAIFVNKKTDEPLRDAEVVERIAGIIEKEGADAWVKRPAQDFLGEKYNAKDYQQIFDIVDVWFESGSTHAFVLEQRDELSRPADLYLEGSDQHRGWFQSSLLESCGTRGNAPFKGVLTHGFLVDESGKKMSKSLGNVLNPDTLIGMLGADVVRLWPVSCDFFEDLKLGNNIIKQQEELYRRLRNTIRYMLGSLNGYTNSENVEFKDMPELEQFIIHRLKKLQDSLMKCISSYDLNGYITLLHNFCSVELSAFYFDIRKDSLYCDSVDDIRRKSCRTVIHHLFESLVRFLAPIIVFTTEEAWQARYPNSGTSVHMQEFEILPDSCLNNSLEEKWIKVRHIRSVITSALERAREEKTIRSSLQAKVLIFDETGFASTINEWDDISIVSAVVVHNEKSPEGAFVADGIGVIVQLAEGEKCERCWKILPEVQPGCTCERCKRVCDEL